MTREELYKKIWGAPLRSIAKRLGISDVGLAKLCKRNGIPKPPQGYHLKKEGYAKARLVRPLPPIEKGQLSEFKFDKDSLTPDSPKNKLDDEFSQFIVEHNKKSSTKDNALINNHIKQLKSHRNQKDLMSVE